MAEKHEVLVDAGNFLRECGYVFTTITPESHRRVNLREENHEALSLRDIFGWSRRFRRELLPSSLFERFERADLLETAGALFRSKVRYTTAAGELYAHSAFPTTGSSDVFFGPDTYRFLGLLDREVSRGGRAVDVGCGSGAGGLSIASRVDSLVLADINPEALTFSKANAALCGRGQVSVVESDLLSSVAGGIDLVISNPPYLIDSQARVYRHGGGELGEGLAVRIVSEALDRLSPGGKLVLYTGTAVLEGVDTFWQAVRPILGGVRFAYREIDPDVFGEELETQLYRHVERIAVVSLVVTK